VDIKDEELKGPIGKAVYVKFYDHVEQRPSLETFTLEEISRQPQIPNIQEIMGWLVYVDELYIQIAKERDTDADYTEKGTTTVSFSNNTTVLKSAIIKFNLVGGG